jgi:hypothetical protein
VTPARDSVLAVPQQFPERGNAKAANDKRRLAACDSVPFGQNARVARATTVYHPAVGYLLWEDMLAKHPAGHLVVGMIEGSAARSMDLLGKLLRRMDAKGDYSFRLINTDGYAAHVVFERKLDADTFAISIGAAKVGKYPGWKSQRSFRLDERCREAIAGVLKTFHA